MAEFGISALNDLIYDLTKNSGSTPKSVKLSNEQIYSLQDDLIRASDDGVFSVEYAGAASELKLPTDVVMRFKGIDIKRKEKAA